MTNEYYVKRMKEFFDAKYFNRKVLLRQAPVNIATTLGTYNLS
jgi:hypothetical protein